MNVVFFGIVALAFLFAALNGTPQEVGDAAMNSAKGAVELAIGLIGYIALFLGLVKVVEKAGGMTFLARIIRPIIVRLFPDVPPDHPAVGAMVMNMAANALGIGNAATPFGLKAMKELQTLNKEEGTATNAMVMFLAINTSGLALISSGIIGLRANFDSVDPAGIFPTTMMATAISTICGVLACKFYQNLPMFRAPEIQRKADSEIAASRKLGSWSEMIPLVLFAFCMIGLVLLVYHYKSAASAWIIPSLVFGMLMVGVVRRVRVYEAFIEGAKEGFQLGVMIIPYMVALLVAVGMFRASGGLLAVVETVGVLTEPFGLPAEALPLAILRPLSGSGGFALTAELIQTHGVDSYIGNLVSTMNGSTETTFYVLAVYFGSVGITRIRHAVAAGLTADIMGVIGAVIAVQLLLN